MFNIMVTSADHAWEEGVYTWPLSRIFEGTADAIKARFTPLSADTLQALADLPTLFMYEQQTAGVPRVGKIVKIQSRGAEVRVVFEFDHSLPAFDEAVIQRLQWDLQLEGFEFSRSHWAVKEGDLNQIFRDALGVSMEGAIPEPVGEVFADRPASAVEIRPSRVFVVHGRDEAAKHSVARFLETKVRLEPVILSERPNQGRSILTKFQQEAEGVEFAVVIMTADERGDIHIVGTPADNITGIKRARQNVVFELGFFIGKFGPERVCALVAEGVEIPSDFHGIVYIPFDNNDGWQRRLVTELQSADIPVSADWWK